MESETVTGRVVALGKVDEAIARIDAEAAELEGKLKGQQGELAKVQAVINEITRVLRERRQRVEKAEDALKKERQALVERRKALGAINDYKTQLAVQREVEHASKQLDTREEGILKSLEDLEPLEKELVTREGQKGALTAAIEKESAEFEEARARFADHRTGYVTERTALFSTLPPEVQKIYDRVHQRYPHDPTGPVIDRKTCGGCYVQVGPQVVVHLLKGEGVVQCPSCKRILFIPQEK